MSFTQAQSIYASAHEDGLNDLLLAFYNSRPRYFNYGSGIYAPATTAAVTSVPTIPFPGIAGGIPYRISLDTPRIDLDRDSNIFPQLPPGQGQFTLGTIAHIGVGCADLSGGRGADPNFRTVETHLRVLARGKLTATYSGPGTGELSLNIDQVEIVDIRPDHLENVVECLMRMILQVMLSDIRIPFRAISLGAFLPPCALTLQNGPNTEEDQVKIYGDI